MENESSMKEIIRNALEEIRSIMDADTIVGQPVRLDNGTSIIPISKVSMGFASGGLDLPNKAQPGGKKNFGGGGGTGVSVTPVGFLTAFPDGHVELLPLKPEQTTPIEQVADILNRTPEIIGKIKNLFGKNSAAESKSAGTEQSAAKPVSAQNPSEENLTEKVLSNLAKDESYAVSKSEAEDDEKKEKVAKKKESKKDAGRRRASFDDTDED